MGQDDETDPAPRPVKGLDTTALSDDSDLGRSPTAVAAPGSAAAVDELGKGDALGRYMIVSVLGRGGMGVVYEAYDPELDRKVALKVLRPLLASAETLRLRFQREARAMAKVTHPGIVPIHDVGRVGDHVFLSMELMPARSARRWVEETHPPWQRVVAAYIAAGRGLAAAHAAGIVHRDVKPENILVDPTGLGRMTDFGLATAGDRGDVASSAPSGDERAPSNPVLTLTGELMGTPAYMSPEQHAGHAVDARSDQFSFCVSLWEALAGERPFDEGARPTLASIRDAVTVGRRRPVPPGRIAGAIRTALDRGLAIEAAARWPTMDALLHALERALTARRRVLVAGLGTAGVLGVVALIAWQRSSAQDSRSVAARAVNARCAESAAIVDDVWNAARRDALVARLGPRGGREDEVLDGHAGALRQRLTDACLAPPGDASRARQRCLEDAVATLRTALDDRSAAPEALPVVADLSVCDAGAAPARFDDLALGLAKDFPAAAASSDGQRIAVFEPSGSRIRIVDRRGAEQASVPGPANTLSLRWQNDGNALLAMGRGAIVRVHLPSGTSQPIGWGHKAALSPDGKRLAFDGPTGLGVRPTDAFDDPARLDGSVSSGDLSWSPSGRWLATCGVERLPGGRAVEVRVLDPVSGVASFTDHLPVSSSGMTTCAWAGDDRLVVVAGGARNADALVGARLTRDGARQGPWELIYTEQESHFAVLSTNGAELFVRRSLTRPMTYRVTSSTRVTLDAATSFYPRERDRSGRLLAMDAARRVGWYDLEQNKWIPIGQSEKGQRLTTDGDHVIGLRHHPDHLALAAWPDPAVAIPGFPRRVEVAVDNVIDWACRSAAPARCVVLAARGDRLLVLDVARSGDVRTFDTALPHLPRNIVLSPDGREATIGVNDGFVEHVELDAGTWRRQPTLPCKTQFVRWTPGPRPRLVGSQSCSGAWRIAPIDGTGPDIALENWPSFFVPISDDEMLVVEMSASHSLGLLLLP